MTEVRRRYQAGYAEGHTAGLEQGKREGEVIGKALGISEFGEDEFAAVMRAQRGEEMHSVASGCSCTRLRDAYDLLDRVSERMAERGDAATGLRDSIQRFLTTPAEAPDG